MSDQYGLLDSQILRPFSEEKILGFYILIQVLSLFICLCCGVCSFDILDLMFVCTAPWKKSTYDGTCGYVRKVPGTRFLAEVSVSNLGLLSL